MNRGARFTTYVFLTIIFEVINILFHLPVGLIPLFIVRWLPWPMQGFLHPILEYYVWETVFVSFIVVVTAEALNWILERKYRTALQAAK